MGKRSFRGLRPARYLSGHPHKRNVIFVNETEAKVMELYLELKDFDSIDREMGFKPGWSKTIIEEIKKKYCSIGGNYGKI